MVHIINRYKTVFVTVIIIAISFISPKNYLEGVNSIEDNDSIVNHPTFTSLDKALENPLEVYKLDLSKNRLKEVPEGVFTLSNLYHLNLSKNKLKEISSEIGSLKKLKHLNVDRNKLTKLPDELGELSQLEELLISRNEIQYLPNSIVDLKNLKVLDMWSNEFEEFPEDMEELKSLELIDMRGIIFDIEVIKTLEKRMPNTKIKYSNTCNCKF